jgi:hypothetical protein
MRPLSQTWLTSATGGWADARLQQQRVTYGMGLRRWREARWQTSTHRMGWDGCNSLLLWTPRRHLVGWTLSVSGLVAHCLLACFKHKACSMRIVNCTLHICSAGKSRGTHSHTLTHLHVRAALTTHISSPPEAVHVLRVCTAPCRYKSVVHEMIPRITDEELMSAALLANEEVSAALHDYEDLMRAASAAAGGPLGSTRVGSAGGAGAAAAAATAGATAASTSSGGAGLLPAGGSSSGGAGVLQ